MKNINSDFDFNINSVINALVANDGKYIDTHNGNSQVESKLSLLLIQIKENGDSNLCAGFKYGDTPYFCLNSLYVNNGKVYLSTCSCGGTIDYRYVQSTEEGIEEYNKGHRENKSWSKEQISVVNLIFAEK